MLKSLTVNHFALIENAHIDFAEGLNIITGETGAGKSILIDALSVVLGGRSSPETIRTGTDFYRVEALFDITGLNLVQDFLTTQDISPEEDGSLIISRRLSRNGKNVILINGCNVPLSILRQIGEKLVDMHGQHENQALLRPHSHLTLLDAFAPAIEPSLAAYGKTYRRWSELVAALAAARQDIRERVQRLDMLNWQTEEISKAGLEAGEEEALTAEIRRLVNSEKIVNAMNHSYLALNQDSKGSGGVLSTLAEIKKELTYVTGYDPQVESSLTAVTEALYQLEEVSTQLRRYQETVEFSPDHLVQLQDRQNLINNLKRKYGANVEEILRYQQDALRELTILNHSEERQAQLERELAAVQEILQQQALQLTTLRQQAAQAMSQAVSGELSQLGMSGAVFPIEIIEQPDYGTQGCNQVTFFFSANPGEEAKALHKIASGGELSRVALALKTVCADREGAVVMVFDEIDAGIGGQTARLVADAIARLALTRQILCITHLPQIASMADHHIYIEKQTASDQIRTRTGIRTLHDQEQLAELSRMMSGNAQSKLALDNAAEMLANGREKKNHWRTANPSH